MTEAREPPPERGLFARIAVDIRPLRESRDFRRLWFGTGISAIGSQITAVAIDIATFGASLFAIWRLPPVPPAPDADPPSLRSIADGFRYVFGRKVLLGIFVVDANAMIFGMPRALFPALAEKLGGGAGTLGLCSMRGSRPGRCSPPSLRAG